MSAFYRLVQHPSKKNGGATRCNQLHGNEGGDIYGRDPVSENTRAIVTAGFAKDVDEVNQ
jgi:hypothetical protein